MQEKDYINYDYIDVLVKKQNQQEIIDAYSSFLWENIENKEDARYNDVVNLSFKRDVKVLNKDRLAFLQVCYENALNKRAEIKSKKHSKSIALICNLAFFSLAGLIGIGVFIYFFRNLLPVILASIGGLFIFALDIFAFKKIKKMFLKEYDVYKNKINKVNGEISQILKDVNILTKSQQEKVNDRGEKYAKKYK